MERRHKTRWYQVTLLADAAPGPRALPSEIRGDAIRALGDLLLAHLRGDAAQGNEGRDESEDQR